VSLVTVCMLYAWVWMVMRLVRLCGIGIVTVIRHNAGNMGSNVAIV